MRPQIGLQLYTLRDQLAENFTDTIRRVADIGFEGVETAFFGENITAKEAKQSFDALGLTVLSAHCSLPFGETEKEALTLLTDLQCRRAVWHGWPQDARYATQAGIAELAELYNNAASVAQREGLLLGLHNHWWEFEAVEGKAPFETLLPLLDPEIFFELDTYWLQTAGQNPAAIVSKMGARAPLLHIKDGPATQNDPMVAVGSGTLNVPAILEASAPHAEWLIVEMDACAGDIWEALEESYRYLKALL
jgi:sugar phosphate isomerase/epimerase